MLRRAFGPIVSLALTGCAGTAVLIEHTPAGGVLHLEGDHAAAMADARRQMSEHCRGAYHILGEADSTARAPGESGQRNVTDLLVAFACGVEPERPAAPQR